LTTVSIAAPASNRGHRWSPPWSPLALAALLGWLVGYPLLATLIEALREPKAFLDVLARPDEWLALWRSVWTSLASVGLAALVGVPLAFAFERSEFPGRRLLSAAAALPVALPPLVGVIAFLFLYGESGFATRAVQSLLGLDQPPWRLLGPAAILLVHTYSMYVYFYLFTRAGLARLDGAVLEAAASLGASPARTLWRVTLPLLRPSLLGASLLTFMTALASFSAPYLFGGNFRVMTTQIVASKLNGELAAAQVETLLLAAVALVALWVLRRLERTAAIPGSSGVRGTAPARRRPARRGVRIALALSAAGLAILFLLPHAVLFLISFVPPFTWTNEPFPPALSLGNYRGLLDPERLRPIVNSLWMAVVSTVAALALGFAAARIATRRKGPAARAVEALVALPWAIPGTVFAVAMATAWSVHSPWTLRFVLIGTPWILPLAYLVRSLPVTGRAALAGMRQLDPALEDASASLGAGPSRTLRRVVLPLLHPALAAGAGLAFLAAFGDFVVSIVLYTYDTRPISIEILSALRLQDLGLAAAYGVLLAIGSTAVFFLWGRSDTL
jgi:iron(III) transport system permease protein